MRPDFMATTTLSCLLTLGGIASGALGMVIIGFGEGVAASTNGSYLCEEAAFTIRITYLPGQAAVMDFQWVGAELDGTAPSPNCFDNGGAIALGTIAYDLGRIPPATFSFSCTGSEAQGLTCADGAVRVGPYSGIGSSVWLVKNTAAERFAGSFVAA